MQGFKPGTLHYYCAKGDLKGVKGELAKHPTEINQSGREYGPSLHVAAAFGRLNVVNYLLSQNVPVDSKDRYGQTALMLAAGGPNKEPALDMVKFLLSKHAGIKSKRINGENALTNAVTANNLSVANFLYEQGLKDLPKNILLTCLQTNTAEGDEKKLPVVGWLIAKGVNVNAALEQTGETALHLCVISGYPAIAQLLIEKGANVSTRTVGMQTSLSLCAEQLSIGNQDRKLQSDRQTIADALRKAGGKE